MIAVTTHEIPNATILEVRDAVFSHVVFGTNIFSDIAASFRDVFGGRSASYQKQLLRLTEAATDELKASAKRAGANALVGLRVDFEELSAGKAGMFMVVASGTPVVAKFAQHDPFAPTDEQTRVSGRNFLEAAARIAIDQRLESVSGGSGVSLSKEFQSMRKYGLWEYLPALVAGSTSFDFEEITESVQQCDSPAALYSLLCLEGGLADRMSDFARERLIALDAVDFPTMRSILRATDDLHIQNRITPLFLKAFGTKGEFTRADLAALIDLLNVADQLFPERCEWREKKSLTGKVNREWRTGEFWYAADLTVDPRGFDRAGMNPTRDVVLDHIRQMIAPLEVLFASIQDSEIESALAAKGARFDGRQDVHG